MSAVSGNLVGRLIGAKFVNYGRFRCITTGAFLQIIGISLCLISTVPTFFLGRFVYAFGSGIFFSSSFRYVEECSPPNYLSLLFTIYSFGISLHRPTTTLISTLIIPDFTDKTPVEELLNTNSWRWFIGIPMTFCVVFLLGMFTLIRYDTPMFLISQKRYDEAKKSIKHFSSEKENQE